MSVIDPLKWLAEEPWGIQFLVFGAAAAVIAGVSMALTRTADPRDRSNDNVSRAAQSLLASAFVFCGSFVLVNSWNENTAVKDLYAQEFSALSTIVHEVEYEDPGNRSVRESILEYAAIVRQDETRINVDADSSPRASEVFMGPLTSSVLAVQQSLGSTSALATDLRSWLDDAMTARSERIARFDRLIPTPIVALLLLLGVLNIVAGGLFPAGTSAGQKATYTGMIALVVTVVLVAVFTLSSGRYLQPVLVDIISQSIAG